MSSWVRKGFGKSKRTFVSAALLALMVLLNITGCAGNPAVNQEAEELSSNNPVNAPVIIKYTVSNPIEILDIKEDPAADTTPEAVRDGDFFSYNYIQIKGLKDSAVEKKINDKLLEAYQDMKVQDLPPYRGIKARIPEGSAIVQENIYMMVTGNFNHILSVMIQKNTTYAAGNQEQTMTEEELKYFNNTQYVSEAASLNLDLNTGEEITLEDLFCDNVDYLEILNQNLKSYLAANYAEDEGYYYTMSGDLKLVSPFQGLTGDQKFNIYPYGIGFLMDYETPQFDTRMMAMTISLSFSEIGDTIAVTERFYDENTDLFLSDKAPVKSLSFKYQTQDVGGNDYYKDGNLNIYTNWRFSSKLPEELQRLLISYTEVKPEEVQDIKKKLEAFSQEELAQRGEGSYENSVYADFIGEYVNVSHMIYTSIPNYFNSKLEYHCYGLSPLKELELEDLFLAGFEYKPLIVEAMKKSLLEQVRNSGISNAEEPDEAEVLKYYNGISGFNLSPDSVVIPVYGLKEEQMDYTMVLDIPYSEFGCDNMTIFQ